MCRTHRTQKGWVWRDECSRPASSRSRRAREAAPRTQRCPVPRSRRLRQVPEVRTSPTTASARTLPRQVASCLPHEMRRLASFRSPPMIRLLSTRIRMNADARHVAGTVRAGSLSCDSTTGVATPPNWLVRRIGPCERARLVLFHEAPPAEVVHVDDQILTVVAGRGHDQSLASQVVKTVRNLLRT